MGATTRVSLEEYLNTGYEPDCDYVDGVLEERNVGRKRHSRTQKRLLLWLAAREQQYGYEVLPEQRVKVAAGRVRVPDICLVAANDDDEVQEQAPLLGIEVWSPEDRMKRVEARLKDFLGAGVPMVWLVDPYSKQAWTMTARTPLTKVEDGVLRCERPALEIPLREIWPEE
ncbi:MAG: Uma2 family endonuclease [Acidobacteriaceae bacterium]|nr:Uma2 family endonuclease [Acidobacteriaceae bacterium]